MGVEFSRYSLRGDVQSMNGLFHFESAVRRDSAVHVWLNDHPSELGEIARYWFDVIRECGDDVRELLHDGHPTACVGDAAFAYINVLKSHVNVGFFRGAVLPDPACLLEGTGKYMRHVKLRPGNEIDGDSLSELIGAAYSDMWARIRCTP